MRRKIERIKVFGIIIALTIQNLRQIYLEWNMFNYVFSSQLYLLSLIIMADPGGPNGVNQR